MSDYLQAARSSARMYTLPERLVNPSLRYYVVNDHPNYLECSVRWLEACLRHRGLVVMDERPAVAEPGVCWLYVGIIAHKAVPPGHTYIIVFTEQPSWESIVVSSNLPFFSGALGTISPCRLVDDMCAAVCQPNPDRRCILPYLWAQHVHRTFVAPLADRRLVLQYGHTHERRERLHNVLQHKLGDVVVSKWNSLWGSQKDELLAATRVVFAPMYYLAPSFTTIHRIAEATSAGCLVVAESGTEAELEELIALLGPAVTFAPYDALAEATERVYREPVTEAQLASLRRWSELQRYLRDEWDSTSDWRDVVKRLAANPMLTDK